MNPTECLRLWIANDARTYRRHLAMVERAKPGEDIVVSDTLTVHREPANVLADMLKTHWEQGIPEGIEGVWLDLMQHALCAVEWRKLALDLLNP